MAIRELPPDGPDPLARRRSLGWLGVLLLVAAAAGAAGWLARGLLDGAGPVDPEAAAIGHVDDFPVGSLSQVDIDTEFFDPYGVEDTTLGAEGAPGPRAATLLVLRREAGDVVAMYASSRWRGCRVEPIDRERALEFFTRGVPDWFTAGLLDPCHGGLYAATGEQILGPGERGLDRFPVRYAPDGTVLVDLTRPLATGSLPPGGRPITLSSGGASTS